MNGVLINGMQVADEGKDPSDAAEAKEQGRWAAKHQKLEERQRTHSPSRPSEVANLANTLISDYEMIHY